MSEPRIAPYGSWASPITSDLIVASSIGLGEILVDGSDVYWIESRPQEQGRSVVVHCSQDGQPADATPVMPANGQGAFNVRTRVHEYGGGAYLVSGGVVYFCNDADQRLYRQQRGAAPVANNGRPSKAKRLALRRWGHRRARKRMIWVCEDHTTGARSRSTRSSTSRSTARSRSRALISGNDFYSAPRLSPDNARLAWLEWRHPNMPWDGTELWVGRFAADGAIADKRKVAGGDAESVLQPEWSPDGILYFVSDRSGWWNIYRIVGDPLRAGSGGQAVYPLEAEFGSAQWSFRPSRYAFTSAQRLVCSYYRNGSAALAAVDLDTLSVTPIATEFTEIASLRADADHVYFVGASPTQFPAIVQLTPSSGRAQIMKVANTRRCAGLSRLSLDRAGDRISDRERANRPRPVLSAGKQ